MTLYTFHAFRADGAPLVWDAASCGSLEAAHARAAWMLETHSSAQSVAIWADDVQLSTQEREQPWPMQPPEARPPTGCPGPT